MNAPTSVPGEFAAARATEKIPCPVCGQARFSAVCEAGDYEYELPGTFFVARCRGCGLILQNPRPPFADILRYYTERYEPFGVVGSSLVNRIRDLVLVRPRVNLYQSLIGERGRIVDVGCGAGRLLLDLKRASAWELKGVEPTFAAAEIARGAGLDVVQATLEESGLGDASFDLAVMNHVLEHLPDPRATVAHVHRILRPGGWFAGEIPSPACLERLLFGRYWSGYHLPRHLTFFSRRQLAAFLERAGFRDMRVSGQPQPSSWLLSASNYLRARHPRLARLDPFNMHNLAWLAVSTLPAALLKVLGSAPILRFVARKPADTAKAPQ